MNKKIKNKKAKKEEFDWGAIIIITAPFILFGIIYYYLLAHGY